MDNKRKDPEEGVGVPECEVRRPSHPTKLPRGFSAICSKGEWGAFLISTRKFFLNLSTLSPNKRVLSHIERNTRYLPIVRLMPDGLSEYGGYLI